MGDIKGKIQKSSRIIVVVLRIIRISFFIGIAVETAGLVWCLMFPGQSLILLQNGMAIYSPFVNAEHFTTTEIVATLIIDMVEQGFVVAILFIVTSIFKTIERMASPFISGIPRKMKTISALLIVSTIFTPSFNSLFRFIPHLDFAPSSASIGLLGILAIAGICYCFARIFEYGCMLQQENDETL